MLKIIKGNNVNLLTGGGDTLGFAFEGYPVVISPAPHTSITATINGVATTYTTLTTLYLNEGDVGKFTYASTDPAYIASNSSNCDGASVTFGVDVTSTYYVATSSVVKTINVSLTATNGSVVPSSITVLYGDTIDWVATANNGYHLSGQSNSVTSVSGTTSPITTASTINVASFVINKYTITFSEVEDGTWNNDSNITNLDFGTAITVTREPKSTSDTSGADTVTVTVGSNSRTLSSATWDEQYYYLITCYMPLNVYSNLDAASYIYVTKYVHTASIDFSPSSTSYSGSWDDNTRITGVPYGTSVSYSYSNQDNSSTSGNASVTITIDGFGSRTFTATNAATAQYYYTISLSATNNTAVTGSTTTKAKYINYTPAITRNTHSYGLTWSASGDINPGVDVAINGATVSTSASSYSSNQSYGVTYAFTPKTQTGYTGSVVSGSLSGTVTGTTAISYKWTENSYTIAYRNGTAESGTLAVAGTSYNFSSSNASTAQLASQSRKYTASATIGTNNGTKANYAKTGTYSVTYNRGNADSSATVPSEQRVDETWKYTAGGWNTASDGTGTNYANGSTVAANTTTALTLYPKFTTSRQSWGTILLATNSMSRANTAGVGYTVTYNRGVANSDATIPSSQTGTSTYSYTADGWNTASNGSGTNYSNGYPYTPSANLSLYPKYNSTLTFATVKLATNSMAKSNSSGTSYTIKYYKGTATGGTVPSSQTATDTISYSASGWNTASDGSGTNYANGANYTASANLSLYPKYTSSTTHGSVTLATNSLSKSSTIDATYTVSYDRNGASGTTADSTADKTRSYTANGWTITSGNPTQYYSNGQVIASVSSDLNLYPCFTQSTSTASVTLPLMAGVKAGHSFGGWNTNSSGTGTNYAAGSSYTPTGNITLYAKWTENTYSVIYYNGRAEGGTASVGGTSYSFSSSNAQTTEITRQSHLYTASATIGTNSATKANYTLGGSYVYYNRGTADQSATVPSAQQATDTWKYTAGGWNTKADGSGTDYANGATHGPSVTSSLGLYPKFTTSRVSYGTITLATNNMAKSNTTQSGYSVTYNLGIADSTSTVPSAQTATDTISYTKAGWNTASDGTGTNYADGASYTASVSMNLYPKYTSSTTRGSVTLATNNMTKANTNGTTYTVTYKRGTANSNATVPSAQSATDTISYSKNGWNTASNGSGTHYNNGASYTATAALSLYPQFSSTTTHNSVTLATNDLPKSSVTHATYTVTYNYNSGSGSTPSATASNYTYYSNNGWTTTSGSSTRSYTNGQSVTLSSSFDLYPCYTATTTTSSVVLPSTATRNGYTFNGWNTKSDGSGTSYAKGANYTPTGDVTLYAKWNINAYTINLITSAGTHASGYWTNSGGTTITQITNVNYGTSISASGNTLTVGSSTYTWHPSADSHYHVASSSITIANGATTMPASNLNITGNVTATIDTFTMTFTNGDYGTWDSTTSLTVDYGTAITYEQGSNQTNSTTSGKITWKVTVGSTTRTFSTPAATAQYYYSLAANQSASSVSSNLTFKPTVTRSTHTYSVTFTNNTGGAWDSTTALTVNYGTSITYTNNSQSNSTTSGKATWVVKVGTTTRTFTTTNAANAQYYYSLTANQSASSVTGAMDFKPTVGTNTHTYSMSFDTIGQSDGTWDSATSFSVAYGTTITYTYSNQTNSSTSGSPSLTVKIGSTTRVFSASSVANAQYYYTLSCNQSAATVTGAMEFVPTISQNTHTYSMTFEDNTYGTWDSKTALSVAYGTAITYTNNSQTNSNTSGSASWVVKIGTTTRTFSCTAATAQYYYTVAGNQSAATVGGAMNFKPTITRNTHTYSMTFGANSASDGAWDTATSFSVAYGTSITYSVSNQTNSNTSGKATWTVTIGTTTRTFSTPAADAQYYRTITANQSAASVAGAMQFKPTVTKNTHTYTVSFTNPSYGAWGSATKTVAYGVTWSTSGTTVTFSDGQTNTVTKSSPTARTLTFTESDSGNYGSWSSTSSVSVFDYIYTTPTVGNGSGTVTGNATITASNSRSANTFTNTLTAQPTNSSTSGAQTWTISGTNTAGNSFSRVYTMATNTAEYYYYMTRSSSTTSVTADTEFKATTNRATHSYTLTITLNSNVSSIDIEWDQGTGGTTTYTSSTTAIALYGQTIYATATAASGYQISGGTNLNDAITVTGNLTVSATASRPQRTMTFTNGTYGSWNSTASLTVEEGTAITYTKSSDQTNSTTSGTITWKVTIGSTTRTYTTPAATAQYYYGITANQSASSVSADMNFKPTVSRSTHTYSMTFANGSYGSWNSTTSLTVNYGTSISYTKSANQTNSTTSGAMTWKVTIGSTTRTYTTPNANSTYYYEMTANQSASSVSGAMQFKPTVTRKTHTTSASWHTVFSGDYPCDFAENETYTDNIVSDSHLTSSNKVRVTFGWYLMDIDGNVSPISDDSPEFYGSTSLSGPYNGWSNTADTYIDIYIENGSLMVDTTTEGLDEYTQYVQVIEVTQVEVYY